MRCFLAIRVSPLLEPLLHALGELRAMDRSIRAVAPENLHLTLQFLGETDRQQLDDIVSATRAAASNIPSCTLPVKDVGVFPSLRRPTVVWAGLALSDDHPLRSLVTRLGEQLKPLGFLPEERAYQPHITMARIKARPPAELSDFLKKYADRNFGQIELRKVDLMISELTPHGPQYSVNDSVALAE